MYASHCFNMLGYAEYRAFVKDFLIQSKNITKPEPHSIEEIIINSNEMGLEFPNERFRIRNQSPRFHPSIQEEGSTVYPFIQENVFVLYCAFLDHKIKYGTNVEKAIYTGMSMENFVDRLLAKRCVSFFGKKNRYLLRTGEIGNDNFRTIGTDSEIPPLTMRDYLTLDEIKLSSFIFISSCTENKVTIGICGLQLDKKGLMDYQDIFVGKSQNCKENGYGPKPKKGITAEMDKEFHKRSIWNDFYRSKSRIYGHFNRKENRGYRMSPKILKRYVKIERTTDICDCYALEKRYSSILVPLLVESNSRAKKSGKMAYVWVNKNRMGLESMTEWQEDYFFRIFVSLAIVLYTNLYSVFCIHFENFTENCWIKDDTLLNNNNECDPYFWNKHPNQGIKIRLSSVVMNTKAQENDDHLHISTYSANPNSLPGNEYWMKKISLNKESTTHLTSHSFISELHNPFVNRRMVSGQNLHIATEYGGTQHISEYCSKELENRYQSIQ